MLRHVECHQACYHARFVVRTQGLVIYFIQEPSHDSLRVVQNISAEAAGPDELHIFGLVEKEDN